MSQIMLLRYPLLIVPPTILFALDITIHVVLIVPRLNGVSRLTSDAWVIGTEPTDYGVWIMLYMCKNNISVVRRCQVIGHYVTACIHFSKSRSLPASLFRLMEKEVVMDLLHVPETTVRDICARRKRTQSVILVH